MSRPGARKYITNQKPTLSVILPFLNAERTLDEAIMSIAEQTFKDFECILVDNNSPDKSREIALKWTGKDSRFTLITEKQQGVAFASNAGWKNSEGKYIARMDADDWSHPERFAKQVEFLNNNPDYGAVGNLVEYAGRPHRKIGFEKYVKWNNALLTHNDILKNRFIDSPIVNPTAMWRREIALKYGMYKNGDFPEDYEMWLRWLHEGVKICKIPAVLLQWNDSKNRLSRTKPEYSDEAFYRIKTHYLAKWLKAYNPFHPEVVIWGPSRISRVRASLLETYGIRISAYIDIKKTRQLQKKIIYYQELPTAGNMFILVYIRQWQAKEEIRSFLNSRNYAEGKDYLMVS